MARKWTATVTLVEGDEALSVSVSWYRPGVPVGRWQHAHKHVSFTLLRPGVDDPKEWLRTALRDLERVL